MLAGVLAALIATVCGLNYLLISQPVTAILDADSRNTGYSLSAHYDHYLDVNTLVLDLREVRRAAPLDLFRAIFQAASALHASGRSFEHVILAHAGEPVFVMKGDDFWSIGGEFEAGQNPVYLIRTLPEKLYSPGGAAAFGRWEGGWLGVLGKQMDDANKAAQQWAGR